MRVLISGAGGLVGQALQERLRKDGIDVNRLVRVKDSKSCCNYFWDPYNEEIAEGAFDGVDAVINLSGESIAGYWSENKKKKIRESRIKTTSFLSQTISHLDQQPKTFICASAIGYYGDRGDELLTESSKFGTGFLADVCREWEAATAPATAKGIRVVNLRIGVVLNKKGGALAKMLLPFKLGAGGIVGSGNQFWSWISLEDLVGAIQHVLTNDNLSGALNAVAPNFATNKEFTKTLGKVLARPTILPLPEFAAKTFLGEMADALLLSSAKAEPKKLVDSGYEFKHKNLETALRQILHR